MHCRQWLHTIQWPDGPSAPHDWGISWLELLFNFYLCTGQRVKGRKTQIQQYVPVDSTEAVGRPLIYRALEELRMTVAPVTTYGLTPVDLTPSSLSPTSLRVLGFYRARHDQACDTDSVRLN